MSTYIYMRVLESAPLRYDRGIRILSLGRVTHMYDAVARAAVGGTQAPHVLEIGCGSGNLTQALLARGAHVTAIDFNPEMLDVARQKLSAAGGQVDLQEMAAVEIADRFPAAHFDVIASTLALSEMSEEEQAYVLAAAWRVLRPGGRLVIADEVRPTGRLARFGYACLRWPLAIVTYLITQTTTTAVQNLTAHTEAADFCILEEKRLPGGIGLIHAQRPAKHPAERPLEDGRWKDV